MGLDLRNLAASAFSIGKSLADQAFEACTVRFDPTTTADPVNNTTTLVWGHEFAGVQALGYEDADERKDRQSAKSMKTWLIDRSDIVAAVTASPNALNQQSQLEDASGVTWEAYRVEFDPSRSVILLFCES